MAGKEAVFVCKQPIRRMPLAEEAHFFAQMSEVNEPVISEGEELDEAAA